MINEIKLAIPLQFSILVCLNYKCTSDTRTGDISNYRPALGNNKIIANLLFLTNKQ